MDVYHDEILDYYRHPRNKGHLDAPTLVQHERNASCGDELTFMLHITSDGTIDTARFDGIGCAVSLAAASMLAEDIEGKNAQAVSTMTKNDMLALLGIDDITPTRLRCALLGLQAITRGIHRFLQRS